MASDAGFVPDMGRRNLMNALLVGSVAGPLLVLPAVLISFLIPAKAGGGGGGETSLHPLICSHILVLAPRPQHESLPTQRNTRAPPGVVLPSEGEWREFFCRGMMRLS